MPMPPVKLQSFLARGWVGPIAIALLLGIAFFDFVTGIDVTFITLLYILPIALGTWFHRRRAGFALSALAVVLQCVIVFGAQHPRSILAAATNQGAAFGIFAILVVILERLHGYVRREQQERASAVNQLRHSERLNTIGTLAAGVAHELGTPMNVILGRAKIVARHGQGSAVIEENARIIVEQTERMTRIIHQLLDFSRSAIGVKSRNELGDIAESVMKLLADHTGEKAVTLALRAEHQVFAEVDRGQIVQVLVNVLMNAIHASPSGSTITISVGSERASAISAALARIEVADHGSGMSEDTLAHVFEPFFTTKDVGMGTGLGLSVAHGIVQEHGGWIRVTSKLAQGSTFAIFLPQAGAA